MQESIKRCIMLSLLMLISIPFQSIEAQESITVKLEKELGHYVRFPHKLLDEEVGHTVVISITVNDYKKIEEVKVFAQNQAITDHIRHCLMHKKVRSLKHSNKREFKLKIRFVPSAS